MLLERITSSRIAVKARPSSCERFYNLLSPFKTTDEFIELNDNGVLQWLIALCERNRCDSWWPKQMSMDDISLTVRRVRVSDGQVALEISTGL